MIVRSLGVAFFVLLVISLRADAEMPGVEAKVATIEDSTGTASPVPRKRRKDPDECITDPLAIEDLRSRREELDNKERELTSREVELTAKRRALDEEIKRLEEIRDQIARIEDAQRSENEEKVNKIVETLEGMSPKTAAALFTQLDDGVSVAAMMRMDSRKLAKVLNQVPADRASRLTELLAGVARARRGAQPSPSASNGVAEAKTRKGGEN